ncbi:MAG TPA: DUF5996 family protein [Alphaproteobacteria bacterium]|jgi:hypothetical protein|nr:DUF5996 family protein [Alphaproteobacteria bacterium]
MATVAESWPTLVSNPWPALPLADWRDTCETLQRWTQIVGKVRLALTPWLNHSWHSTLYVTPRGLTTSPIPYCDRTFSIDFDFLAHCLVIRPDWGPERRVALRPRSVADFYGDLMRTLAVLDIEVSISRLPNELPDATPFDQDTVHHSYDPDYVQRFWRVLVQCDRVFKTFRTGFLGKASPVHFFWGSFDLAVTRFSGRRAPMHPGGVPHLPDAVTREAYSHEVSSAGFWPGGGAIDYPAFYSYAYPAPPRFNAARVRPEAAFFHDQLGEFILPYDAVRTAEDPGEVLLDFLQSTYDAAADLGGWDRAALECDLGVPGRPRPV